MAHLPISPLHGFRRRAVCTLAVLSAVLSIALAGVAFGCLGSARYLPPSPTFDAHDVDAKALRPQQQVAFRRASRPIRLGSSSGTEATFGALQCAQHPTAQSTPSPAPHVTTMCGYLQQRTRGPRGPPVSLA
jgi:hypothetical protein